MTDTNTVRRILTTYKRVAIVGLSANPSRPSYSVGKYLLEQGFEVIPVNPKYDEVLGQKCYPDLAAIPKPVDIVNLFQRAERVPPFVDAAIDIGASVVWMQLGIVHEEAAKKARKAGLEVVMDRCIKIEHAAALDSDAGIGNGEEIMMQWQDNDVGFGTEIRKSPFFAATLKSGAQAFSVYNHMYIPRNFGDPVENYWNLVNAAILCDVAVERQVEITGPDAARFVQLLTPRNLSKCEVGQCKYVLLTSDTGGIINDPVMLRLGENHFWLSIADADVLLWAKGVAVNSEFDVTIDEPDVSPLQLQGPKSLAIMQSLFGEEISELRYFWFYETMLDDIPVVVSRTGWSNELGYEIFLRDGSRGEELWQRVMDAGEPFGLRAGHTSTIRRVEAGMLSYRADMDIDTNPYELGLGRLVDLDMEAQFIGKAALARISAEGVRRQLVGLEISGEPLKSPNTRFWPLFAEGNRVGKVTSAVYSPRLDRNIALAMVASEFAMIGTELCVFDAADGPAATVVEKPFIAPRTK